MLANSEWMAWRAMYEAQERDMARLKDLLCVIHRDGGHYTAAVGLDKSAEDAKAEVTRLFSRIAELEQAVLSANTAAKVHYDRLTANNEAYRAEMERMGVQLTAAQAQNAGLREVLEKSLELERAKKKLNSTVDSLDALAWRDKVDSLRVEYRALRDAALSASPAQSVAAIQKEVLMEAANLIRQTTPDGRSESNVDRGKFEGRYYAIEQIEGMADQLEDAAKGEVKNGATD